MLLVTSLPNVHRPFSNSFSPGPNLNRPNVPKRPAATGESKTMMKLTTPASALATLVVFGILAAPVFGQTATTPYQLSVFAGAPSNGSTAPDSIAVLGDHVFLRYADVHDPPGTYPKNSQVIEA